MLTPHALTVRLERMFPERRVFVRSETETRFVRLSPVTQIVGAIGTAAFVSWAVIATAVLLMDSIGAGSLREQAERERLLYEDRLNALSEERDQRAEEARLAQRRFNTALDEVSEMQAALLAAEKARRELEAGIEVIQTTLRDTLRERDRAREQTAMLTARLEDGGAAADDGATVFEDMEATVDFLAAALHSAAGERDQMASVAAAARTDVEDLVYEKKLIAERNDRIFQQLEEAVTISISPLDQMFRAAGLPTDRIIEDLRRSYSGQGGPLTPLTFSTKDEPLDPDSLRANEILAKLDELNLYRMAAEKAPFSLPLRTAFRYTSGFGPRWGRMHNGTDFAGAHGSPIHATADGVVIHADWLSGYGRLVKIQHDFGIETRYAHLSEIRVSEGQKVSRGDVIGAMGNSGRSTGTHLHYEVRVNEKPVNPMTYIKAANDVF
jgi:murein DD-endopeptidase MepM/ murein hydrolase activator NlpD